MRCDECKYSKIKTQMGPGGTLDMKRLCFFHVPQVQLVPQPGGIGQITYRPVVEDDDFCQEFKQKEQTDVNVGTPAATNDQQPSPDVDNGGSTGSIILS